jgi:hypothetical protein
MIQQGDVLFHSEKIPAGELERVVNPVIQEGEHTGHAHRILGFKAGDVGSSAMPTELSPSWEILRDKATNVRYLRTHAPIEVGHEEHKTVTIPPGEYRIGIVQEYDHFAEEARQVLD